MKLYGYWRSSASYRVRIALALKGLEYDYIPVNLLKGEQCTDDYLKINPNAVVPSLVGKDGIVISQSLAIMEYLEEKAPTPAILPKEPERRAHARQIAATLACEAQPFMNLRVQQYLKNDLALGADAVERWLNQFAGGAMLAVEKMVAETGGDYCVGDAPTIADCCLIPQMFGAQRFGIDTSAMPLLTAIYDRCHENPAFEKAHPMNQPDAVEA
ncbi:MAG: maleylacetoacetate isomerase [Pseudomonadota bacterium]